MIHRDDVIGCVIAALERGRSGEIYNAVDDEPVSHSISFRGCGGSWQAVLAPRRKTARQRANEDHEQEGFESKTEAELGYHFKYPIS